MGADDVEVVVEALEDAVEELSTKTVQYTALIVTTVPSLTFRRFTRCCCFCGSGCGGCGCSSSRSGGCCGCGRRYCRRFIPNTLARFARDIHNRTMVMHLGEKRVMYLINVDVNDA